MNVNFEIGKNYFGTYKMGGFSFECVGVYEDEASFKATFEEDPVTYKGKILQSEEHGMHVYLKDSILVKASRLTPVEYLSKA